MKTRKWNGEYWYEDRRSLFSRARRWCIWFGGWERPAPEHDETGLRINTYRWSFRNSWNKKVKDPFPMGLFDHRIVFFGDRVNIRLRGRATLALSRKYGYISRDSTPSSATQWIYGWDKNRGAVDFQRPPHGEGPGHLTMSQWADAINAWCDATTAAINVLDKNAQGQDRVNDAVLSHLGIDLSKYGTPPTMTAEEIVSELEGIRIALQRAAA